MRTHLFQSHLITERRPFVSYRSTTCGQRLLGRRHSDRGLGEPEEFPAQGWLGRAARAGAPEKVSSVRVSSPVRTRYHEPVWALGARCCWRAATRRAIGLWTAASDNENGRSATRVP